MEHLGFGQNLLVTKLIFGQSRFGNSHHNPFIRVSAFSLGCIFLFAGGFLLLLLLLLLSVPPLTRIKTKTQLKQMTLKTKTFYDCDLRFCRPGLEFSQVCLSTNKFFYVRLFNFAVSSRFCAIGCTIVTVFVTISIFTAGFKYTTSQTGVICRKN